MSANKEILAALQALNASTGSANDAAGDLFAEVLRTNRVLASEATLVREAATLLRHVLQNFRASLAAPGSTKSDKPEVIFDH